MKELEVLASKLGVAVELLWEALLRQAIINGIVDLIFYILIGCSIYPAILLWKWIYKKVENDNWDEIAYAWPGLLSVVLFILILAAFLSSYMTVASFLNPEYWALDRILKGIK